MYIIQMRDTNYVKEIALDGHIQLCPLDFQAKKFIDKKSLKPYTDFLNEKHSRHSYKILNFSTEAHEIEY